MKPFHHTTLILWSIFPFYEYIELYEDIGIKSDSFSYDILPLFTYDGQIVYLEGGSQVFRSKLKTIVLALSVSLMALSLIAFPQESVAASIRGLNMWLEIVFPSLLPFFIISEMLIGFGVVRFIGSVTGTFNETIISCSWCGWLCLGHGDGIRFSCRRQTNSKT